MRRRPLHRDAAGEGYVLAHPAVSTVIAGMRTVRHVERNAPTSDRGPLPQAQREALQRHRWERSWYRAG